MRFLVPCAVALALVLLFACSSSSTSSCSANPFSCWSGTTCLGPFEYASNGATLYECVQSGSGHAGEPCTNVLTASPPTTTCGEGLFCFQRSAASGLACAAFCDSAHVCPLDETCTVISEVGSTISLCLGAAPDGGGVTEAGTPAVDAGVD